MGHVEPCFVVPKDELLELYRTLSADLMRDFPESVNGMTLDEYAAAVRAEDYVEVDDGDGMVAVWIKPY